MHHTGSCVLLCRHLRIIGSIVGCPVLIIGFNLGVNRVEFYSPDLARFARKTYIWIFLPCDIVSLTLQGVGGSLSAASSGGSDTGVKIAMAGLIFQVITLVAFIGLSVDWLVRLIRSKYASRLVARDGIFFSMLSLAMLAILVRCVFRAYELKEGYHGDAITDEPLYIGLEGV
jgi:hypothetical protein